MGNKKGEYRVLEVAGEIGFGCTRTWSLATFGDIIRIGNAWRIKDGPRAGLDRGGS
jgi:hypothetical protein